MWYDLFWYGFNGITPTQAWSWSESQMQYILDYVHNWHQYLFCGVKHFPVLPVLSNVE